jgi:DMSO reductase anchor subunit
MKKEEEIAFKILTNGFLILAILSGVFGVISLFWTPRIYSLEEINRILYMNMYFLFTYIFGVLSMIFSLAFFVIKEKEKRRQEE